MFAGGEGSLLEPLLKNKENSSARKVADVAENVPGRLCITLAETELLFDVAQKARAAGMEDPALDVFATLPVALEETVYEVLNLGTNHFRDVFGEKDVETGVAEIETHSTERVRECVGFCYEDTGARLFLAGDYDSGRPVSEEDGRDEVSLGNIFALEGERGKLNGDDQDIRVGVRLDVIRRARDGHGTGSAAKFGKGHAANVGAEAHEFNEVGVEGRNHEAGTGDGDDEVNILRAQGGFGETLFGSFAAKFDGVFDVLVIGLAKCSRFNRVIDRENRVTLVDLSVIDNGHHGFDAALGDVKDTAHVIFHVIARDKVWRQSGSRSRNGSE